MTSALSQLEQYRCHPVVVTFYKEKNSQQALLAHINCQLQMIADPEQKLYNLFTLGRLPLSLTQWSGFAVKSYAALVIAGLYTLEPELEVNQLLKAGGDCVIRQDGLVTYSFQAKGPTHRPEMEDILAALKEDHC